MHGNVSFIELGTSDTERSRPFFERVFGWTFNPMAQGGGWFQAPSMRVGFHGEDTPQIYVSACSGGTRIRSILHLPRPARHPFRPSPEACRLIPPRFTNHFRP
jgi:hypothetical protein